MNHSHKKPKQRILDLIAVVFLVIVAISVSLYFKPNFLSTTLLFFGLPSLYLIIRKPSSLKKALVSAVLFGLLWGFSFDFFAEFNQAWSWSTGQTLLFPGFFFGVVSLDIMVWFFLWIFLAVLFYEYFIEYDYSQKISKNIKYSIGAGLLVLLATILTFKIDPRILEVRYAYLLLGILAFGPFLYLSIKRPSLLPKFLLMVPFFFFLYLSFEITALNLNLWDFPGYYIGLVQIFGISFPVEEFFFWIMVSSAIAASYHELYVDNQK